ncbi:MAG: DUF1566 domain-containing protein [Comamonadaceae bacterium]|nr:MAG: DUF1566 domain-containing protein [Comamonadaceae bacterium]
MLRVSFPVLSLMLLLGASLQNAAVAQDRFKPSADGLEVTDSKTGLIWRRCPEGMAFKGKTCIGQAVFVSQVEATGRAKAASAGNVRWRLPQLKELATIAAPREASEGVAAIDPVAFPATPAGRFWTSSTSGHGYFSFVGFTDGGAGENARTSPGAVRLVRGGGE